MTSDNIQINANLTQGSTINFGEQLKSARDAMGLSPQEAAARLNLSPRFITMLENEDLLRSSLPPIYLRGYLRSYSRLLNIPEREISAILETLEPTPVILTTENIPADSLSLSFPLEKLPSFSRLGTMVVSLILLTSITAWWYLHSNSPSPTVVSLNQPLSNPDQLTIENQPPLEVSQKNTATPSTVAATPIATVATAAVQQPAAPATPPAAIDVSTNPQLALAPKAAANPAVTAHPVQEEADDTADEQE